MQEEKETREGKGEVVEEGRRERWEGRMKEFREERVKGGKKGNQRI